MDYPIHIAAISMDLSILHSKGSQVEIYNLSLVGTQNLVTLIFTKTTFCRLRNTKCMSHILSNSCSSRSIRTPLKSINHASKNCIYERYMYHYFGAHFTEMQCFAMKKMLSVVTGCFTTKYGQIDVTQENLFIMMVKSLLEVQNTNNSEFECYYTEGL